MEHQIAQKTSGPYASEKRWYNKITRAVGEVGWTRGQEPSPLEKAFLLTPHDKIQNYPTTKLAHALGGVLFSKE